MNLVRVDFYMINDHIYFGEYPFHYQSRMIQFIAETRDKELGKKLNYLLILNDKFSITQTN